MEVEDLFTDLADWRTLMKLLEKSLASHLTEDPSSLDSECEQVIAFLHTKVRLENIAAEDIVDGNKKINLFWSIILL